MRVEDFVGLAGRELGVSRWVTVDQERIERFADVTQDWQDIHVDPEAARNSVFGTTIAHGFLSLSLLSAMLYDIWERLQIENMGTGINYGFDSVRFLAPVKSGARIRGSFRLAEVQERRPGQYLLGYDVTVESEDGTRPVLVARWLGMVMSNDRSQED